MNYKELRKLLSNTEELNKVYLATSFLGMDNTIPIRQRLWHIQNDLYNIPKCKNCQVKDVKWNEKISEYRRFCSSKCSHNHDDVKTKTEQTCLKKYGVKTNLATVEHRQKQKELCIETYGVENISQSTYFKEKYIQTCMERYGVSNVSKLNTVKAKIDETHQKRYGRKRQSQAHINEEVLFLRNNSELMRHWYDDLKMSVYEIAEKLGVSHSQLCLHFKNNLGINIKRHQISSIERGVCMYLDSIGVEYETSNRTILKPKELDIVVESSKVAIEINGLIWHSELMGKSKNYHLDKMNGCIQAGYRLIQITDEEWVKKQQIVQSRLSGVFGKNTRIWARKCDIRVLDVNNASIFFNESHIQGHTGHKVAYGLYHGDVLVAAMSFCKSRYNKNYEWELLRYSNKLYTNVIGGASKLLKHFEKTYNSPSIISYCDLRWNTGAVYENIGFTKIHQSDPNYWYIKNGLYSESRIKYQKHKLKNILEKYDPLMTEWDNMKENGYNRIWDCGNYVYGKKGS